MKNLVLVFVLMLLATPVLAQTVPTVRTPVPAVVPDAEKGVRHLLANIHEPPTRALLERAAPDPLPILRKIAAGSGPLADRALAATFLWPNDATFAIATAVLADARTTRGRKNRLILLLSQTYGTRAEAHVLPFLRDADPQLRINAAIAARIIGTRTAHEALDDAIDAETDEAVAAEMQRPRG